MCILNFGGFFLREKKFCFYSDYVGFMFWGYVKFYNNFKIYIYYNEKYIWCYKYLKNCLLVFYFEYRLFLVIFLLFISYVFGLVVSCWY